MSMMRRRQHRVFRSCLPWLAGVLTLCAGCTVGPHFVQPTPEVPAHWSAQAMSSPSVVTFQPGNAGCIIARFVFPHALGNAAAI